jgi:hypothetical protein
MKQFWLLAFVFVFLNWLGAQEVKHAPTVEQCRADQRLWMSQIEEKHARPRFIDLDYWLLEMNDCTKVDRAFEAHYHNTETEIVAEQSSRYFDFLERHNLHAQFMAEDAQGQR